jgi:mannose-6-phosphate isomerase-like protein (cupin superfamily)
MTPSVVFDLQSLQRGMTEAWKSLDLANVNGNAVRLRVMQGTTANWHVHETSDELFYVISGTVYMDTEHGTNLIEAGQLFVVPAGTQHRSRVEGRATLLVIDRMDAAPRQDATSRTTTRDGGTIQ